jgi:hypothetical protein
VSDLVLAGGMENFGGVGFFTQGEGKVSISQVQREPSFLSRSTTTWFWFLARGEFRLPKLSTRFFKSILSPTAAGSRNTDDLFR